MRLGFRIVAFCVALCALFVAPARAQQAVGDLFTVAGVLVDESAADARQARASAFARAQQLALQRLASRLATSESYARTAAPQIDDSALNRMVIGLDLEEERRSGTRYIASLAVRFDPGQVRTVLQSAGYILTETRAPPVLVTPVPLAPEGFTPAPDPNGWRQAWQKAGLGNELAPVLVGSAIAGMTPDWATVQPAAYEVGAQSAIFATLRQAGATLTAQLTEVAPNGVKVDRGAVTTQVSGGPETYPDAYRRLIQAANARIQAEWKSKAVRSVEAVRGRMTVSALYRNQAEWTKVKQSLEELARGAISEIRIEAIAQEGALVSFAYAGTMDTVITAFRRRGLYLADTNQGPVARVAN